MRTVEATTTGQRKEAAEYLNVMSFDGGDLMHTGVPAIVKQRRNDAHPVSDTSPGTQPRARDTVFKRNRLRCHEDWLHRHYIAATGFGLAQHPAFVMFCSADSSIASVAAGPTDRSPDPWKGFCFPRKRPCRGNLAQQHPITIYHEPIEAQLRRSGPSGRPCLALYESELRDCLSLDSEQQQNLSGAPA